MTERKPPWNPKYGEFDAAESSSPLPSWEAAQRKRGLKPTPWKSRDHGRPQPDDWDTTGMGPNIPFRADYYLQDYYRARRERQAIDPYLWPEASPKKKGGARS